MSLWTSLLMPHFSPERKLAIVTASWHSDLLEGARNSCLDTLRSLGETAEGFVDLYPVPGSLEIPLVAQKLAQTRKYSAVIAFGLIIDGGIYRHDFVANAVISNLVRVQLDTGVPVFSCVLTPLHFHEHEAHTAFFREHLIGKGAEVAKSCLAQLDVLARIAR